MNNTLYKTKNPISKFIIIPPKSCTDDPESYPSKFADVNVRHKSPKRVGRY